MEIKLSNMNSSINKVLAFKISLLILSIFKGDLFAQSAETFLQTGQNKMRSKDINGALADFTTAINMNPKYELAYVNRGLCRMAQGKWELAIPDCKKAIELNPNQAVAYFILGCAKANTGKSGCNDLYKSLELGYSQAQQGISRYCQ